MLSAALFAFALPVLVSSSPLPRPDHVMYLSHPVEGGNVSLSANVIKEGDNYHIVAQRISAFPGTPYTRNGVNPHNNIFFRVGEAETAGLVAPTAPNSGDSTIRAVYAEPGKTGDGNWIVNEQTKAIEHQVRATVAFDQFYLCEETLNGESVDVLKVNYPVHAGKQSLPANCVVTTLIEVDI